MKKCISCGQDIPDDALFCFHCCASQTEKTTPEVPIPKRKKPFLIAALVTAAAVIIVLAVIFLSAPKTYDEGTASLSWKTNGTTWNVLLRNSAIDTFHWKTPQGTYERALLKDENAAVPLQLYVYDENTGENVSGSFLEALKASEVTTTPADGSQAVECSEPLQKEGFPDAALVADILYDTNCTKNELEWRLNMNNGDTLILHETVEIGTRPEASYSYETTPLETTEDLQNLIDTVQQELSPEAAVTITLAPVVYEGDIQLAGRQISLEGTTDGTDRTTLTGKLRLSASGPTTISLPTYHAILFEGADSGIEATETFFASECEFFRCETGVTANEGSWAMPYDCTFTDCGTGFLFDSTTSTVKNGYFSGLTFKGNETAICLEKIPGDDVLYFIDCVFENNGEDIVNHAGNRISYELEGEGT